MKDRTRTKPISDTARRAQADCLRAKGYQTEARQVERGDVDYDPDALEMLETNPNR